MLVLFCWGIWWQQIFNEDAFWIKKAKYLEALDRQDKVEAIEILVPDLKKFSTYNEEVYKEMTQL